VALDQRDDLTAVSPTISSEGVISYNAESLNVSIKGVVFDRANQIYEYDQLLLDDQSNLALNENEVVVGIGIKDAFNLSLGSTIEYKDTFSNQDVSLQVVGFLDYKSSILNNTSMVTNLSTTQTILNLQANQVQTIETQLKDIFAAEEINQEIMASLNNPLLASNTWIDLNEDLLTGLNGQSISSLMIQIFVIVSVVLGISSVLAITVLQKSRQLGILKAMGIKDSDASKIFLFEGVLLGFFGAVIGILLGILFLYGFETFADTGIPIRFDPGFLALSGGVAIAASTIASLSPAIKSSKLSVIEVIRNG
jgi:lipoprotein-releasing system permease protein